MSQDQDLSHDASQKNNHRDTMGLDDAQLDDAAQDRPSVAEMAETEPRADAATPKVVEPTEKIPVSTPIHLPPQMRKKNKKR